jgi:hypothetical protein
LIDRQEKLAQAFGVLAGLGGPVAERGGAAFSAFLLLGCG